MGTPENSRPLSLKRDGTKNPVASEPAPIPPQAAAIPDVRVRRVVVFVLGSLLLVVNAYFGTYAYVVAQAMLWNRPLCRAGRW